LILIFLNFKIRDFGICLDCSVVYIGVGQDENASGFHHFSTIIHKNKSL